MAHPGILSIVYHSSIYVRLPPDFQQLGEYLGVVSNGACSQKTHTV